MLQTSCHNGTDRNLPEGDSSLAEEQNQNYQYGYSAQFDADKDSDIEITEDPDVSVTPPPVKRPSTSFLRPGELRPYTENDDDNVIGRASIAEMLRKLLQVAEENKNHILDMKKDIMQIKFALNPSLGPEDCHDVYDVLPRPLTSPKSLEEFCAKSEEPNFRQMGTAFFSNTGGKNPGDLTRNCLDKLMSNDGMMQYNVHGRGLQGKWALKDLPRLTDVICKAVRHWWKDAEKIQETVLRAMGEHLKGAKKRYQKASQSN